MMNLMSATASPSGSVEVVDGACLLLHMYIDSTDVALRGEPLAIVVQDQVQGSLQLRLL